MSPAELARCLIRPFRVLLVDEFPAIPVGDLVREVSRAKDAVGRVDLPEDEAPEKHVRI
jgi:hypothetical protein